MSGNRRRRMIDAPLLLLFSGGPADTTKPTVAITSAASGTTAAAFTCTFTFSENVTGFAVGDITVSANAGVGTFVTVSGSVYTAVVTPTAIGTVTVDVAADVCQDAAGNTNTAATQFSIKSVLGLAAYWKLDESSNGTGAVTRNDSFGTSHLTDNNTTASAAGLISNGADFERNNSEFFHVNDNAALSTGDIDFMITAWINLETVTSITMGLVSKWVSTKQEYALWFTATKINFSVSTNGTAVATRTASTFGNLSTGTWYFVVAWHDSVANTINVQINNGTVDSTSHTGGVFESDSAFTIGRLDLTSDTCADGIIDEVGFWKRILSANERTALYNGGSGNTFPFDGTALESFALTGDVFQSPYNWMAS